MKLTILVDNNTIIDRYLLGEPGVCYYIELDHFTMLFDTGYSDVFIQNALVLGITLNTLNAVVLSHGHNDHSWGLGHLVQYLDKVALPANHTIAIVSHPDAWQSKTVDNKSIGMMLSPEKLPDCFSLTKTKEMITLADNLYFLGEIPRSNHFENQQPIGTMINNDGVSIDDYVLDDSAIVYDGSDGLVIITGCSHSGICNIIKYAQGLFGDKKIQSVIGGFHLLNPETSLLDLTTDFFNKLDVKTIYPCHCTDLRSKMALATSANVHEVGVGSVLVFY